MYKSAPNSKNYIHKLSTHVYRSPERVHYDEPVEDQYITPSEERKLNVSNKLHVLTPMEFGIYGRGAKARKELQQRMNFETDQIHRLAHIFPSEFNASISSWPDKVIRTEVRMGSHRNPNERPLQKLYADFGNFYAPHVLAESSYPYAFKDRIQELSPQQLQSIDPSLENYKPEDENAHLHVMSGIIQHILRNNSRHRIHTAQSVKNSINLPDKVLTALTHDMIDNIFKRHLHHPQTDRPDTIPEINYSPYQYLRTKHR